MGSHQPPHNHASRTVKPILNLSNTNINLIRYRVTNAIGGTNVVEVDTNTKITNPIGNEHPNEETLDTHKNKVQSHNNFLKSKYKTDYFKKIIKRFVQGR